MEFKLNKIDTELRQQVQDSTKEGLIHRKKKEIIINKDLQEENKQKFQAKFKKHSKRCQKAFCRGRKSRRSNSRSFMDKDSKKLQGEDF